MIKRYSHPDMQNIWSDKNKYLLWLKVETEVCAELTKNKIIPDADWRKLKPRLRSLIKKGGVEPKDVEKIEQRTGHDIIAFTEAVANSVGGVSRYFHFGLTSSDVLDTSLAIQIQEAGRLIEKDIKKLLSVLSVKARKYKNLATIGRSHGIFAEPTSFGLKYLSWANEWGRNQDRFSKSLKTCAFGKLSGAVGVSPHWDTSFEKRVLLRLGLKREPVSTQVVPRDRHAELIQTMALCGSSIERIAVELRHLQRSEVGEVLEGFKRGQKGSSAMPHKRNPISSENLTGIARLLRSYAGAALENVSLWHERDISHSSVERVVFPDAMILLSYALRRLIKIIENLEVRKEAISANLQKAGQIVFSGHYLLALVKAGATRENAYKWIQDCALQSMDNIGSDFVSALINHSEINKYLKKDTIKKLGSLKYQLRNVDNIYKDAMRNLK